MSTVPPIPAGFNTITAYITVDNAEAAIELYKKAFGAELKSMQKMPNGKVMNSMLKIGDSMLMVMDEFPDFGALGPKSVGGTSTSLHLYVEDVDSAWAKAISAGMEIHTPLMNMPWGDRYGSMKDPFGHSWTMGTHVEDVSPDELSRRFADMEKNHG